jgi:hypothetical protein
MKRLISFFAFSLLGFTCMFAGSPLKIMSGTPAVLNNAGDVAFSIDYSNATIEGKTVAEYLKDRGDTYTADWPADNIKLYNSFVGIFNRKNDLKIKLVDEKAATKYKMIWHINALDMGNTAASFLSLSMKGGGAIMSGTLNVYDTTTHQSVASIAIGDIKGITSHQESMRRMMVAISAGKAVAKFFNSNKSAKSVDGPVVKQP